MAATTSSYSITMRLHTAPDHGIVGAVAIAVATAPTTPWSGAVCRRMVIEYDEVVAAMSAPFTCRSVTGKSAPRYLPSAAPDRV